MKTSYVGTLERPIQVLVDRRELSDEEIKGSGSDEDKAWKAAHNGLMYGFGYGTIVHNLTAGDFSKLNDSLDICESEGDVITGLYMANCPERLGKYYVGPAGQGLLVRITTRNETCEILESMVISQQYILCRILERGLEEQEQQLMCKYVANSPLQIVSYIECRFIVTIPRVHGMQDYLRIVEGELDWKRGGVKVEKFRSALVSTEGYLYKPGKSKWECGWGRNGRQCVENEEDGLFVAYTVLPTAQGGLHKEVLEESGIRATITEEVQRGFTGRSEKQKGRYYEYVKPLHPGRRNEVRTVYMSMGSSIVVPITAVVRFGGHAHYDVQVFGIVIRTERVEEGGEVAFRKREYELEDYEDVDEYGMQTELLKRSESSREYASWDSLTAEDQDFVIGTIPTVKEVELGLSSRREMVSALYDVLDEGEDIKDVYRENPILQLVARKEGEKLRKNDRRETRRMWLEGRREWMVDNVPYGEMEKLLGEEISYPFDLTELKKALQREMNWDDEESKKGEKNKNMGQEAGRELEKSIEERVGKLGKEETEEGSEMED